MTKDDRGCTATQESIVFPKLPIPLYLVQSGSFKEYIQTAKMSGYGLSTEQIADVLKRDKRTILEWQKALGQKCESFHLTLCSLIGLTLMSIQMDEIWSYLQKKKRQLWLFITLESKTKFWVNFERGGRGGFLRLSNHAVELGSRTSYTANRLIRNIVYLMPWGFEDFLLVTTDKLAAYEKAMQRVGRVPRLEATASRSDCQLL